MNGINFLACGSGHLGTWGIGIDISSKSVLLTCSICNEAHLLSLTKDFLHEIDKSFESELEMSL